MNRRFKGTVSTQQESPKIQLNEGVPVSRYTLRQDIGLKPRACSKFAPDPLATTPVDY